MRNISWITGFAVSFTLSFSAVATPSGQAHPEEILKEHKRLVDIPLLEFREIEVAGIKSSVKPGEMIPQIEEANQKVLSELNSLPVTREVKGRLTRVEARLASKLVSSVNQHPVVSSYESVKYNNQPGVEIGFCFGRATYVHLLALHIGVLKESLKKAWIVGPMDAGGLKWAFHVTTIVRGTDNNWLAMDSNNGFAIPLEQWYGTYSNFSTDGKLRLYITDANKFSVDLGKYDKIQMGLDLPRKIDWYSGYFKDMLSWFQSEPDLTTVSLPSYQILRKNMGLEPLTAEQQKVSDFIKDAEI